VVEHHPADPLPTDRFGGVHRLQLRVRLVELVQRTDRDEDARAAGAEERDPRAREPVDVERVDVVRRGHLMSEREVSSEQRDDVVRAGVVDGDRHVGQHLSDRREHLASGGRTLSS
jgi:hypothetical protein